VRVRGGRSGSSPPPLRWGGWTLMAEERFRSDAGDSPRGERVRHVPASASTSGARRPAVAVVTDAQRDGIAELDRAFRVTREVLLREGVVA